jgi:hypothetical protein
VGDVYFAFWLEAMVVMVIVDARGERVRGGGQALLYMYDLHRSLFRSLKMMLWMMMMLLMMLRAPPLEMMLRS